MLDKLAKIVPAEGCETQWERYLAAVEVLEWTHASYDTACAQVEREGGDSSCPSWSAFEAQGKKVTKCVTAAFGALDTYNYAVKHINDKIESELDEVRGTVIDSLSDKLDGVQFNLNHGLLGAKVAQVIRNDVIEHDMGDPPLCSDCA